MTEQQAVVFKLKNVEYGIDILQVNEIVKLQDITKLPNTPEYIDGVINLRGTVIPIIDLQVKFNLGRSERKEDTRIIVVKVREKILGIVVDEVAEVVRISNEQIENTLNITSQISDNYIQGVAKLENRLIILLNLEQIF
ncbi:MAG: chemotaxis protein CheW [Peptococcales bacterium]|jgi:purine-binding chemotaxis protein CheW